MPAKKEELSFRVEGNVLVHYCDGWSAGGAVFHEEDRNNHDEVEQEEHMSLDDTNRLKYYRKATSFEDYYFCFYCGARPLPAQIMMILNV